ncbi:hypothetical protein [Micromonospora sp. NPDC007220]|uniref:hypothetical protein n=1 Tax=Micromonospora sp. NPDC007220 TaxID=3154318 RepID=UPI0033DAE477
MMESAVLGFMVKHNLGKASGGDFNLQPDLNHLEIHFGGSESFFPDEGTLVGRIPANVSNLRGKIPAVASFQVDQTEPGYVRVVAVDASGNRSGPSEATPCTPRLIKDEYIDSLTVSKLTAGTLTANTILGASIRTATTGARTEMNPDGVEVYFGNGTKAVKLGSHLDGVTAPSRPGFEVCYPNGQPMARLGALPGTDRVGMEICDESGSVKVLAGELTDGDYGLAVINPAGELVKLEDFIFGMRKATKDGLGWTTTTTYTNLSDGVGPAINGVTIGDLGRVVVTLSAYMDAPSGGMALMGVEVKRSDGSFGIAPDDLDSLSIGGGDATQLIAMNGRASVQVFIEGLFPGTYNFTAKYRAESFNGGTANFANRVITVQPY